MRLLKNGHLHRNRQLLAESTAVRPHLEFFRQLIVLDRSFKILQRAWCLAEVHSGASVRIKQSICISDQSSTDGFIEALRGIDIEAAATSMLPDKDLLLRLVEHQPGIPEFNKAVRAVIIALVRTSGTAPPELAEFIHDVALDLAAVL